MQFRLSRWIAAALACGAAAASAGPADLAPPPWPATRGAETAAASDPVQPLKMGAAAICMAHGAQD